MRYFKKEGVIKAFDVDVIIENFGIDETWIELLGDEVLKLETPKPSEFHTIWNNGGWVDRRTLEEIQEHVRSQMPNLTKREFRKKLRDTQLFDQVEAYVKASNDGYLQDAWEYADYFARLDPFIVDSCEKLGLSPEQVDSIWVSE